MVSRLRASITGDLDRLMQQEVKDATAGITRAFDRAQQMTKDRLRRDVRSAGLGRRLANTWTDKDRRGRKLAWHDQPMDAAVMVRSKAPEIIDAHVEGATIRARNGKFLAIPTKAGKRAAGKRRKAIPGNVRSRMAFIPRPHGGLLVVDPPKRTKTGKITRGSVLFVLVRQTSLRSSLKDPAEVGRRINRILPRLIQEEYRTTPVESGTARRAA